MFPLSHGTIREMRLAGVMVAVLAGCAGQTDAGPQTLTGKCGTSEPRLADCVAHGFIDLDLNGTWTLTGSVTTTMGSGAPVTQQVAGTMSLVE